jgi:hypothetical protein
MVETETVEDGWVSIFELLKKDKLFDVLVL